MTPECGVSRLINATPLALYMCIAPGKHENVHCSCLAGMLSQMDNQVVHMIQAKFGWRCCDRLQLCLQSCKERKRSGKAQSTSQCWCTQSSSIGGHRPSVVRMPSPRRRGRPSRSSSPGRSPYRYSRQGTAVGSRCQIGISRPDLVERR